MTQKNSNSKLLQAATSIVLAGAALFYGLGSLKPTKAEQAGNLETKVVSVDANSTDPGSNNNLSYVVKKGDSLWKISRRYKTSVEAIMKQNNLKNDLLKPGTTLKIP